MSETPVNNRYFRGSPWLGHDRRR